MSQLENVGWLSLADMAKVIGKSYQTTLKLVHRKAIIAILRGGQYVILEEEVRRFLQHGNHPDCLPPGQKETTHGS